MVQQMAPDATVTWLNGEVSRGHAEIKAYYDRMVKGEKRILDRYTTAAKVGAPARFFGNGEVAVADGTTEDEFFPVARGPFRLSSKWTSTSAKIDGAVEGRRLAPVVQRLHEPPHGRSESGRLVCGDRLPRGRIHARLVHGPDAPAQVGLPMTLERPGAAVASRPHTRGRAGRIERSVALIRTPAGFASEAYTLREHIALVRRAVMARIGAPGGAARPESRCARPSAVAVSRPSRYARRAGRPAPKGIPNRAGRACRRGRESSCPSP